MVRLMLDAHPNIAIPFETNFIPKFFFRLSGFEPLANHNNLLRLLTQIQQDDFVRRGELASLGVDNVLSSVREPTFPALVDSLFRLHAENQGKRRWGDKTPGTEIYINLLGQMFPQARILHVIRDGRDVAISRLHAWGNPPLIKIAHDWANRVAIGRTMGRVLGVRYREVRYEDVVTETERTLRSICRWLQEPFDPGMLEYHRFANAKLPPESIQYHRSSISPPDPGKLYIWRHRMSVYDRAIFQTIAGSLLWSLGYEVEQNTLCYRFARRIGEIIYALRGQTVFRNPFEKIALDCDDHLPVGTYPSTRNKEREGI